MNFCFFHPDTTSASSSGFPFAACPCGQRLHSFSSGPPGLPSWPPFPWMEDGFGLDDYDIRNIYDDIELPTRATSGSAGYDFKTPIGFILEPGRTIKVPTGIRVKINSGWWLAALPRSGMGFKYRVRPDNTVGVVDEDY